MPPTMPKPPADPPTRESYHHGALRQALIDAAEVLLVEREPEGFSLREVARRSGVSPAAPAHHFGDREGLLAEVAALGFQGLNDELEAARARGGNDPMSRLREQGVAYVRFALHHPGRFRLMFAGASRPHEALQRSGAQAYAALEEGVRGVLAIAPGEQLSAVQRQKLLAIWSVVHGFAHLAMAGQIDRLARGPEATTSAKRSQSRQARSVGGAALARGEQQLDVVLRGVLDQTLMMCAATPPRPALGR